VVHGADDPTGGVEQDVEVDDGQRHALPDHAEHHEDVGDHDGGEDLEEVLDPQVHDHEAPEVGDRETRLRAGQQPHRVERRDGERSEEEHPRHVAARIPAQPGAEPAEKDGHPDEQPQGEQDLPESTEVEVLPPLHPKGSERARQEPVDVEELPRHAAEDDEGEGPEQGVGEPVLPARLPPGDDRGEEDASGQERGRRPEDRQLHMPRAHQVVGQPAGQVEAEEARDVSAVVLARGTDHRLDEEEQTDDEEEVGAGPLRRGEQHVTRRAEGDGVGLPARPAQPVTPAAEHREQDTDADQ
jgi:hypothetical protein